MRLAILGATGFTGRVVLERALADGHQVRVLARKPERLSLSHASLEVIQGDALQQSDVERVMKGVEAVVHCVGVGGRGDGRPTTLVSDSVRVTIRAMTERSVERLVCLSNIGAGGSGTWFANRFVIPLFYRWLVPIIEDKNRMEAVLAESRVDWVSVRLPNVVEGPPGPIRCSEDGRGLRLSITTGQVADYVLDSVLNPISGGRTPSISHG